jgi:integrase
MANPTIPKKKKPLKVKRGNVTVKIYHGKNRCGDKVYDQYSVAYYLAGKQKKRRFADLGEAKRYAEFTATKLANAEHTVLKLTPQDQAAYAHATERLKPTGKSLIMAIEEYVDVLNQLPEGTSLREAVEFFARRNPASYPKKTTDEVVQEMLAAKETAGRSEVHIKDMRCRLTKFSEAFQMSIGGITGSMIQGYIDGLNSSGRTKKNHLRHISSLFKFAVKRKCLPKDALEELEGVEHPEQAPSEIEIFQPEELDEILACARREILPWLCIAAFAGLRTAEIQRLEWKDVNLSERVIEVSAKKSKTASRRLAPITSNLYQWLLPYAGESGRVTAFENMAKQLDWLVRDVNKTRKANGEKTKFRWKHNGLRHSFVSYRIAQIKDAAQVALECGNSPAMVFKHYRQLVTEGRADNWFSIEPKQSEKLIPFAKVSEDRKAS